MSHRILIVDDKEHFIEMVILRLRNYGYNEVFCARSGSEAFDRVKLCNPDLIIVATLLTDMDGFVLCQQIKGFSKESVKVILMAGLAEENNVERADYVGADDYVVKSFDCFQLMVAIKKLLS